jgi:hypothetical protein
VLKYTDAEIAAEKMAIIEAPIDKVIYPPPATTGSMNGRRVYAYGSGPSIGP